MLGLIKNSNAAYHASEGISNSTLGLVEESISNYKWAKEIPTVTNSGLTIGSATHSLVLEGREVYNEEYDVMPKIDKRTKEGKAALALFMATKGDKEILSKEDGDLVEGMKKSIDAHPMASALFSDGVPEQSIYWTNEATGELCKIRTDYLKEEQRIIVDLKTTSDIDNIEKSIINFGYDRQAAFYKEGFEKHFGKELEAFIFVFVSKEKSLGRHRVRVVQLSDDDMEDGRIKWNLALSKIHSAKMENNFMEIETITLPAWSKR